LLLLSLAPVAARGQDSTSRSSTVDSAVTVYAKKDDGKFHFTPLLAPAYNPEMGFLIAGGILLSFKSDPLDPKLPRSSVSSTISISTTGAINVSSVFNTYLKHDRLRLLGTLSLKDMTDGYWGVGYEAGLSPTKNDSSTSYHRLWWAIRPTALWAVKPHLYVGPTLDLNRTAASDINPNMAADSAYLATGPEVFNSGLGFQVFHDTRDVPVNAWRGWYLSATLIVYGPYLGGDKSFQTLLIDYRGYKPLGRQGKTLAWQFHSRLANGNVPWTDLSSLGNGYDFRGYREYRFRDNQEVSVTAEYRHTFTRSGGRLSRHGFTAFAGIGVLGTDKWELEGPLPQFGVGYRFELQPRSNVRIDFAAGKQSTGVYFNFQEAF
jgi:outer membrane protein assembly factor BamA